MGEKLNGWNQLMVYIGDLKSLGENADTTKNIETLLQTNNEGWSRNKFRSI